MQAIITGLVFVFLVYFSFSYFAIDSYGKGIQPNIFENLKQEKTIPSYFIRIIFLFIFLSNIPFGFLAGKESLLIIIDEIMTRRMSNELSQRLEASQAGY